MTVAGVVVLYNPPKNIKENINSYLKEVKRLYVVDNSNNNNQALLPKSSKIEYIPYNENKGIAYALNNACRLAIKAKFQWILTMDQDSIFKGDNLAKLIDDTNNFDYQKVAIISPYQETKLNEPKCQDRYDYPVGVITSGNLVNLDIYQKIGGFKDWLFIDGVDIEYCLNARKSGYLILRDNESILFHNLGDIFYGNLFGKRIICTNHSYIRRYYIMRNDNYIYDMYKDFDSIYSQSTKSQKEAIEGIVFFEKDKFRKLYYSLKGYLDYKNNIKGKLNLKKGNDKHE
jgi:rhamnosyltransferase